MHSRWRLGRMVVLAMLVVLAALPLAAQTPINEAQQQWQQLNAQVMERRTKRASTRRVWPRQQAFGPRHPQTLTSLNNLAVLYDSQGRYGEAEPLHREALQGRRRPSARAIRTRGAGT